MDSFFEGAVSTVNSPVETAKTSGGAEDPIGDSTPMDKQKASGLEDQSPKRLRTHCSTDYYQCSTRPTSSHMYAIPNKLSSKYYAVTHCHGPCKTGGDHKGSKSRSNPHPHSRETEFVSTQLESHNTRPVGTKLYSRLHNRSDKPTISTPSPYGVKVSTDRGIQSHHRGRENDDKTSGIKGTQGARKKGIHIPIILSPQKGWRHETHYQSEGSECLCRDTPLQDGGHPHAQRYPQTRRLDDKSRPEGCLLHDSNGITSQTPTEISVARADLPVQLSPIRPIICTLGLYQDHKTSDGNPSISRSKADYIHRRHPDNGQFTHLGEGTHSGIDIPAGESGVYYKSPQVTADTNTRNSIPGFHHQLHEYGDTITRRENKTNTPRCSETDGYKVPTGFSTLPTFRETEPRSSGHTPCSTVLQKPSTLSPESSEGEQRRQRLFCPSPINTSLNSGVEVVATTSHQMEWEAPIGSTSRHDNRNRCLHNWLGGTMSGHENWGTLVTDRGSDAHKLPGVTGSITSNQMLYQRQEIPPCPPEDGQHHSTYLSQQVRRHSISRVKQTDQRDLGVVPGEEHNTKSLPSCRSPKQNSRRGISCDERQNRLDAMPQSVQQNQQDNGTTTSGFVCLPTNSSAPGLRELETRPRSPGSRRFYPGLDKVQRLCQSSLESCRQSPHTGEAPKSKGDSNCTNLEITDLVSTSTGNADSGASLAATQFQSDHTDSQSQQTRHSSTASRMDYLRDRFRSQNLSKEASKLLLASWRQKTSRSYDSLFSKWLCWCDERGSNPISGDINEVVNFLADLFQRGYQYRSLNAYRSAISSIHEKVDGYEVGQHPLVTRLIKGAFHERPPQPRYTTTWDVAVVTAFIETLGDNNTMHLNDLTYKTVMLMALTRPFRSADLASLSLNQRKYSPEGVTFVPTKLAKQSRQTKQTAEFFFPSFPLNGKLCPVAALRAYEERTKGRREGKAHSCLFIALIKPYNPVTSSTIARWIKCFLSKAGIDTTIFKAHSVRGASTSAAANAGVTTQDILNAADWSSESVFQKFYYKPEQNNRFGVSVLSKLPTTSTK